MDKKYQRLYSIIKEKCPPDSEIEKINTDKIALKHDKIYTDCNYHNSDENKDIKDIINTLESNTTQLFQSSSRQILFAYMLIYYPGNYYFYHLCNCKNITKYNKEYVLKNFGVTSRHDGKFRFSFTGADHKKKELLTDENVFVCRDCFRMLNLYKKGYHLKNFDINRFYFEETRKNFFTPTDFYKISSFYTNPQSYSFGWSQYAYELKKIRGYKCERCKRSFLDKDGKPMNGTFLEVHHKDRNTLNNRPDNLEVLCIACHDKEHPHRPK